MASKKYFVDIDLNLNELKSIVVHKLPTASEPAGTAGQIYYNTNTNVIRFFNGSIWQDIATGSVGFDDILTGTNTSATMIVGTGATLYYTGSGSINASQLQGYSIVPLSIGGTSANLTASDGGIVYSTSSAMAILSGTATAGQIIRSGASGAPSWSTATYPATASSAGTVLRANGTNWVASTSTFADTYTQYNLLYASATNTVTGLATANDSILSTNGSGVPSWTSITSLLDAVLRNPSTINYNIIQPTGANTIGLVVRKTASSSASHIVFAAQTSSGTDLLSLLYVQLSNEYTLSINTNAGTGGTVGYIKMHSFSGRTTGFLDLSASPLSNGGTITAIGGSGGAAGSLILDGGSGGAGGSIETYGGSGAAGGSIATYGGSAAGGSITTSNGGGSIDTTGNGSIQFGTSANRITLQGTAASNGKTITLPNITGDALITAGAQTITGIKTVQVDFVMDDANIIKFNEKIANGTSYIGLKAPDSLSASMTYLLPPNGSTGQFLKLNDNGTGELAWATPTGTVARYTTDHTFGGSGTSITVTHNLSTQYVIVRIYDSSWQEVYPQIVSTSSTQATITFAADQGTNAYHIVVMG